MNVHDVVQLLARCTYAYNNINKMSRHMRKKPQKKNQKQMDT